MTDVPLVSIVATAYNEEPNLAEIYNRGRFPLLCSKRGC